MAIAALHSTEFNSYIRGYNAYKDWAPTTGEELVLRREPENDKDHSAKDGEIVGHVPYNLPRTVSHFLRRTCNTGFAEETAPYIY